MPFGGGGGLKNYIQSTNSLKCYSKDVSSLQAKHSSLLQILPFRFSLIFILESEASCTSVCTSTALFVTNV